MSVAKPKTIARPKVTPGKKRKGLLSSKLRDNTAMKKIFERYRDALEESRRAKRRVSFRVEVDPAGEPVVSEVEDISTVDSFAVEQIPSSDAELQAALDAARRRGRLRAGEILASTEMLSADDFAALLGTTRATVNSKRQTGQLIGLDGAKRGYRFPTWQLDAEGRPYAELSRIFEQLGKSPWAVYRFLTSPHSEADGRTGLELLRRGEGRVALEVVESTARGEFR